MSYITSFFDDEKKLGSYLVRFLPLLLSLIYFNKQKFLIKFELILFFNRVYCIFSIRKNCFILIEL